MKKLALIASIAAGLLVACNERSYHDVPPDSLGAIMTSSGFETTGSGELLVRTPGQVDLGPQKQSGQANRLVLIQRSGVSIREQYIEGRAVADGGDNRCMTAGGPISLDVRLVLALPDHTTPDGRRALLTLMHLGTPEPVPNQPRVLRFSAEKVYEQQAMIQVRSAIRRVCSELSDYEAAFAAFRLPETHPQSLSARMRRAVTGALGAANVPLRAVDVQVSNMMPDPSVMQARAARNAATERTLAIEEIAKFLREDSTGTRTQVYCVQALQELARTANSSGNNTILMTGGLCANQLTPPAIMPLPPSPR